jgi:hypothetical protein
MIVDGVSNGDMILCENYFDFPHLDSHRHHLQNLVQYKVTWSIIVHLC